MPLVAAKCTECGASIEVDDTKEAGICAHCGTAFITEKVINNYVSNYNITNNVTKIYQGGDMEDSEDLFQKGLTYLNLKRFDFARQSFDLAIKKDPKIAKNYLYWAIAVSDNFEDIPVFFGKCKVYDKNDTHDIHDFFELVSKEEAEQLSKEIGIDLTKGESHAKLQIVNKILTNKQLNETNLIFFRDHYTHLLSSFSAEQLETIKDALNNYILSITTLNDKDREKDNENLAISMFKANISYGIAPGSEHLTQFTEFDKNEVKAFLNTSDVNKLATKKAKEIDRRNRQERNRRTRRVTNNIIEDLISNLVVSIILGLICGAIGMVVKGFIHLFTEKGGIIAAIAHIFSSEAFGLGIKVAIIAAPSIYLISIIKSIIHNVKRG